MKSKKPPAQPQRSQSAKVKFSMENEGIPVSVQITSHAETGTGFTVDLNSLPAPERRFTADAFSIVIRDDVFHLVFMQRRIGMPMLRAIVDVQMTDINALAFAKALLFKNIPRMVIPEGIAPLDTFEEPEQAATLTAAFARATAGPSGACIDFYFASAYSFSALTEHSKFYMEPEVRIVTSYKTYVGFSAALRVKAGLPSLAFSDDQPLIVPHAK